MKPIPTVITESVHSHNIVHLQPVHFLEMISLFSPPCVFYCDSFTHPHPPETNKHAETMHGIYYILHEGAILITDACSTNEFHIFRKQQTNFLENIDLGDRSPEELFQQIGDSLFKSTPHSKDPSIEDNSEIILQGKPAQILEKRQQIDQLHSQLGDPNTLPSQESLINSTIAELKSEIRDLLTK